jgi:hypothetical protein
MLMLTCRATWPGMLCRDVGCTRIGTSLVDEFASRKSSPLGFHTVTVGEGPAMAWILLPKSQQKLEALAFGRQAEHDRAVGSDPMVQVAAKWLSQSLIGISNVVDGVQGNLAAFSPISTSVIAGVNHLQHKCGNSRTLQSGILCR